jgi:UDP-N-acetylglucosamine transferase subunit ALG13
MSLETADDSPGRRGSLDDRDAAAVILVSLGTDAHPFERALDLVDRLRPTYRLVVQHGHTRPRSWPDVTWFDFVPYETLVTRMRDADVIVCHGGVGTIMTALSLGRRPVVIPRLAARREHVDDHQLQIVEKLSARGLVVPLLDGAAVVRTVDESRRGTVTWRRDSALVKAVVAAVDGD